MKIESPCRENFGKMSLRSEGRYCSACEKIVIDFTRMGSPEIIDYLQKTKNVCGRVKNYQVNKPGKTISLLLKIKSQTPTRVSFTPLRAAILALLSGLLTFTTSCMGKMVYAPQTNNPSPGKDTVQTKKTSGPSEKH
ncbi:MAG: hypothetical protein ACXVNQ_06640 [Bacteroidia bacterium]